MTAESVIAPAHVPPDRIVDVDVYGEPAAGSDFLLRWKSVQDSAPASLVWTPRNAGHWIATRAAEIAAIYSDHEAFSSRAVLVPRRWAEDFQVKPTTLDPPEHTPYRRLIARALSPAAVAALRPAIRDIAAAAIDRVLPQGRCDFVREVATRVPLPIFLRLADLPSSDADLLPRYNEPLIDENNEATNADVMGRFADYLRPHCAARLARPGTDFLSRLIGGRVHDRPLDLAEAVDMATTVMTGGIDTVVSSLGLLMAHLARDADLRARLAADPASLPSAVFEMLRRFPIMTKARLVTRRTSIDGVILEPGEMVVLPPLHGLDERLFDEPMTVDLQRPPRPNLTFGAGVHRCPGMMLALAEIEITIGEWLRRIPRFAIDPELPPLTQSGVLGAMQQLGLTWPEPARPAA